MDWHKIDLHIHTPGSKDYQEPDKTYLDILRKAEAEYRGVAAALEVVGRRLGRAAGILESTE